MRLCRREEGEFDTRTARGEGLLGGPPTGILSSCSSAHPPQLALLEEREDRRSFGGGMGLGDDMAGVEAGCDAELQVVLLSRRATSTPNDAAGVLVHRASCRQR
jgi:hypothetical protein